MSQVVDRFLHYVSFDTQSEEELQSAQHGQTVGTGKIVKTGTGRDGRAAGAPQRIWICLCGNSVQSSDRPEK